VFIDPDFAEALSEDHSSSERQVQRKTQQYCRQVQRALNLALTDLFVEQVSPAPDCGRLLIHVVIPQDTSVAEAMRDLEREKPRLRAEVASAISRKRAPELYFIPACGEEGWDE
jgi:ribosome-binding factor A